MVEFRAMYIFNFYQISARLPFSLKTNVRKSTISNRSHAEADDPDAAVEVTAFFLRPVVSWSAASKRVALHFIVERVRKRHYEEESKKAT